MDEELAKRVFFDVAYMLESIGIKFFLSCGTCLGAYRNGGFIEDDNDVDLYTKAEEFMPKISLLVKALADKGYHFKTGCYPFSRISQIVLLEKHFHLDIVSLLLIDDGRWRAGKTSDSFYPKHLFENPEQIDFLGRKFNIPTPVTEYLEWEYGSDYMIPRRLEDIREADLLKKQFGDFDKSKVPKELR